MADVLLMTQSTSFLSIAVTGRVFDPTTQDRLMAAQDSPQHVSDIHGAKVRIIPNAVHCRNMLSIL